jgi:hypothetical protein
MTVRVQRKLAKSTLANALVLSQHRIWCSCDGVHKSMAGECVAGAAMPFARKCTVHNVCMEGRSNLSLVAGGSAYCVSGRLPCWRGTSPLSLYLNQMYNRPLHVLCLCLSLCGCLRRLGLLPYLLTSLGACTHAACG